MELSDVDYRDSSRTPSGFVATWPCDAGADILHIGAANDDCGPHRDLRHLRSERSDWLLTVLTGVLILLIFVFAPLQAVGITAFHLFAIGLLLAIIGSMVIISDSPTALVLMSIALVANIAVFFLRLYYPVPFHLHILAGAWLIIACTLGIVVTQAVFRPRPCHISPNYRSDPSVPVDRGGLCNTVSFCRPVRSRRDQGDNI